MNFVDSLKIFGVEARQKPSITGSGAPTTETEGAVGEFYMDTDTGDVYKCTAVTDGAYIWKNTNIDFVDKCCPSFAESGSVVTCDPVEGYPLNVVSHIEPVQSGSGDSSPENVRPITGWEQVTVWRNGRNLINPSEYLKSSGNTTLDGDVFTTTTSSGGQYLNRYKSAKHHHAGTYTVSIFPLTEKTYLGIAVYDKATGTQIASLTGASVASGRYKLTFTATGDFRITIVGTSASYGTFSYRLQLEAGTTATEYEPYRGEEITLDLGQTVYGGNLDWKTGLLTITKGNIESYAGEDVPDGWISSTGELSTGAQVVYPIAEPVTVQLTPQEFLGLSGTNTLYSDTGDTDISGKADPTAVIEKLTNAIIALGGNV